MKISVNDFKKKKEIKKPNPKEIDELYDLEDDNFNFNTLTNLVSIQDINHTMTFQFTLDYNSTILSINDYNNISISMLRWAQHEWPVYLVRRALRNNLFLRSSLCCLLSLQFFFCS